MSNERMSEFPALLHSEVYSISNLNVSVSCYWVKRLLNLQKKNSALVCFKNCLSTYRDSVTRLTCNVNEKTSESKMFWNFSKIFIFSSLKRHSFMKCLLLLFCMVKHHFSLRFRGLKILVQRFKVLQLILILRQFFMLKESS